MLERPNIRPCSLHRNGFASAARYGGWIWSGDTQSRWATLAAHVPVGVNHSLSLTPFWGTDIGGFVATRELTGELRKRLKLAFDSEGIEIPYPQRVVRHIQEGKNPSED